jgi:neutral ceramidase
MANLMNRQTSPLRFRITTVDITPAESLVLAGYANRRGTSKGVHRPLCCRCLGLRQGEEALCLIVVDLLELDRSLVCRVRDEVSRAARISPDHILIHCTHTHSGPLMEEDAGHANRDYIEAWVRRTVEAACNAMAPESQSTCLRIEHGRAVSRISTARKLSVSQSGKPCLVPDPDGLNDPSVEVIRLVPGPDSPPVTLINFACHPVTLGGDSLWVSPDFPARAREIVERMWGGPTLYMTGFSGDINPMVTGLTEPKGTDEYGDILGQEILGARFDSRDAESHELRVRSTIVTLPFRDEQITKAFIDSEVERKSREVTEFVSWKDDLKRWGRKVHDWIDKGMVGQGLEVELVAARIGPAVLFFSQGEVFMHYQAALRRVFPDLPLLCVGYTGGETGYIPTIEAIRQKGYETDMAYIYTNQPSPLAPDVERVFLSAARQLVESVL